MIDVEIIKETVFTIDGNPYSEEEAYEIYSALKEHFEPKNVKEEESPFKKILEEMEKEEKNREKEKDRVNPYKPWPNPFKPYPWKIKPYPYPWDDPYRPTFLTTSNKTSLDEEIQKKPRGLRF